MLLPTDLGDKDHLMGKLPWTWRRGPGDPPYLAPSFTMENVISRDFCGCPTIRFHTSNTGGAGSIPVRGTKIPRAAPPKKQTKKTLPSLNQGSGSDNRLVATSAEASFSSSQEILNFFALKSVIINQEKGSVTQLCPTLCNPMDGSPPGSSVHGILQARILEWVAIPFSRGSSQPRDQPRGEITRLETEHPDAVC